MTSFMHKITSVFFIGFFAVTVFGAQNIITSKTTWAQSCCLSCITCATYIIDCSRNACECQSNDETEVTEQHITDEFIFHREWLVDTVFEAHVLPAMMLMAEQMTTNAMDQMLILGSFFDAKHQLETKRVIQTLEAKAHAQYQPSEGMCQFGTMTRSLAATERDKEITAFAMASRFIQRQSLNGDGISGGGRADDYRSRFQQMKRIYCNPEDLSGQIDFICDASDVTRMNNDVDFTALAMRNNLALNFTRPEPSEDEEDVLALQANLYGHRIMPRIPEDKMSNEDGSEIAEAAEVYMKMRALIAKRSVAQASFANLIAERTDGGDLVQPYMIAALEQMGIGETEAIARFGERPSYHTQMMFLTNSMLQDPTFYADLYDKPENVDRKKVSMQAINLKLRSDMYESMLRSNANQSVLLEMYIDPLAKRVSNQIKYGEKNDELIDLPGF